MPRTPLYTCITSEMITSMFVIVSSTKTAKYVKVARYSPDIYIPPLTEII